MFPRSVKGRENGGLKLERNVMKLLRTFLVVIIIIFLIWQSPCALDLNGNKVHTTSLLQTMETLLLA